MVKLDKIYTRGGDKGLTSLGDGERVKKYSLRINTYGEIDEANSLLGISIIYSTKETGERLKIIQNDLFDIGGDLCIPDHSKQKKLRGSVDQI